MFHKPRRSLAEFVRTGRASQQQLDSRHRVGLGQFGGQSHFLGMFDLAEALREWLDRERHCATLGAQANGSQEQIARQARLAGVSIPRGFGQFGHQRHGCQVRRLGSRSHTVAEATLVLGNLLDTG